MKRRIIRYFSFLTALVALFAVVVFTAYADEAAPGNDLDLSRVFASETQLVVYVDGAWSDTLSGSYGVGDTATINAPAGSGSKSFSHWEADGSIISYSRTLKLTMNAHTTLYAVYADAAQAAKPVAGFTSITRTNDGEQIFFQAIAAPGSGTLENAGIVYSTTADGDSLKIGGTGVTNVPAEKITGSTTTMPQSVLDSNNCWMLQITPNSGSTVYHARAYVTISGTTTYGDVKVVKLSDLKSGISMKANLEGFEPGTNDKLADLAKGAYAVTFNANGGTGTMAPQVVLGGKAAALNTNTFTREGYTFSGWSATPTGSVAYTDRASVTFNANTTLYAQWKEPGSTTPSEPSPAPTTTPTETPTTPTGTDTPVVSDKEKTAAALSLNAGLKVIHKGKTATVQWGKVSGADFYRVYAGYCGGKASVIKTVKSGAKCKVTIKKLNGKKLSTTKNIKVYVAAYRKAKVSSGSGTVVKNVRIAKTITGHVVGKNNKKYSNAKTIKLSKTSYTLKKGKKAQIKAKTVLEYPKRKQLGDGYAKEFRYATSNKSVATVSKTGKITAKKKGSCVIYVYARNGLAKKIKVTVK